MNSSFWNGAENMTQRSMLPFLLFFAIMYQGFNLVCMGFHTYVLFYDNSERQVHYFFKSYLLHCVHFWWRGALVNWEGHFVNKICRSAGKAREVIIIINDKMIWSEVHGIVPYGVSQNANKNPNPFCHGRTFFQFTFREYSYKNKPLNVSFRF